MDDNDPMTARVVTAMAARRRGRVMITAAVALLLVVVAGLFLTLGYDAAARALPPPDQSGVAALLWLPFAVVAGLLLFVLSQALQALVSGLRG